jgi:hypothetical protein
MSLCARKACYLNVGEVIGLGIISGPSLNVVARGSAMVSQPPALPYFTIADKDRR